MQLSAFQLKIARLGRNLLALVGFGVLLVMTTPVVYWWATLYAGRWEKPRGETLVVLAADSLGNGILGPRSYWRSNYAALTYRTGGWKRVVITGNAEVTAEMAAFLEVHGVPPDEIVLEDESSSTRESALHVAALLESQPEWSGVALLTSDFHMFRAQRAFERAGLEPQPSPIPDCRKRFETRLRRWDAFLDLVLESVKISYYWAQGWI